MKFFLDVSILSYNHNYRRLFIGQTISFLGTMITSVALPYQIYHLTHSTLMVGLVSLVQLLPLLFTALVGGVFADKYHRRQLLLIAESVLAVGCLLLAWNSLIVSPHIWVIFVVSSLMSAFNGLHRPALDSIAQQIVKKQDFAKVGALMNLKYSIGAIAGPAVGGILIAHFGLTITYLLDFASFAISLVALILMTHIPKPVAMEDLSTWQSLKQGINYAKSRQDLLGTYFVDFAAMIFGMPSALFPAIAHSYGNVKYLGMLYAAPAVGTLVISFFSGWTQQVKRHGAAIAIAASLWGVSIILFGLSHQFWVSLFFLAAAGAFDSISGIFRSLIWNQTIPTELRGRLAGIEMISYLSGPRLGDTESGLVAAMFGITASIVSGGVLCIAGVAVCCYFLPKFWVYKSID